MCFNTLSTDTFNKRNITSLMYKRRSVLAETRLKDGLPRWCYGKESACQGRRYKRAGFRSLGWEDPLEKEMATTPVFLPGESRGQRSRVGYSPTAAAKPLQSCPTLCNPIDGSSPGSSVSGILQARMLEWGCHFLPRAVVQRGTKSWTQLKRFNTLACGLRDTTVIRDTTHLDTLTIMGCG